MARHKSFKKNKEPVNIAGIVITILFAVLLIGGIYYMFNLFKSVEINELNMAGEWKLQGSPTWFLTINSDGTASSYEQYTVGDIGNSASYHYTLEPNENGVMVLTLKNDKTKETEEIKITKVSHAEISIIRKGSIFENMTRVNIF